MDRSLINHPIFQQLKGAITRYDKSATILQKCDDVTHIWLVASGLVRSYDIDERGEKRSSSIFARGALFPLTALLGEKPPECLMYYDAFTDCVCYRYPINAFREQIFANNDALKIALNAMTESYINQAGRIYNLQKSRLRERIEFILYYLAIRIGTTTDGRVYTIKARFTHQDIADLVGVSREAVTNELASPSYEGMMTRDNGVTHIDISLLNTDAMPYIYPLY